MFTEKGEYNFNVLKQIEVTDSFLSLHQDARKCQNEEPYENCTSRIYRKHVLKKCGCLPLAISSDYQVRQRIFIISFILFYNW